MRDNLTMMAKSLTDWVKCTNQMVAYFWAISHMVKPMEMESISLKMGLSTLENSIITQQWLLDKIKVIIKVKNWNILEVSKITLSMEHVIKSEKIILMKDNMIMEFAQMALWSGRMMLKVIISTPVASTPRTTSMAKVRQ